MMIAKLRDFNANSTPEVRDFINTIVGRVKRMDEDMALRNVTRLLFHLNHESYRTSSHAHENVAFIGDNI
jgi:hypothetical protein